MEAADSGGSGAPTPVRDGAGRPASDLAVLTERIRDWLPIAIVIVSGFAAVMGGWLRSPMNTPRTATSWAARTS